MVGCVGNAPTLVRLDIRFTGGSRSLRGYQPEMVAGRGMRGAVAPTTTGRGALTAWTPERQSHHDGGAYETPLVLNLPAEEEEGNRAAGGWASRFEKKWTATALHRALPLARRVTS